MPDALDKLGRNSSGLEAAPSKSSKTINDAKKLLSYICVPLKLDSSEYKPERTVEKIDIYIRDNSIDRILYSEITSFIVGLNENERATASTNLDTLISYVLDNDVKPDIRKISIKLYDHFQLNLIQIENAKAASDKAIAESIADEKEKLHDEVKRIEKDYITILGIFASIMLAFIGSFTFSTSVLNNISNVNGFLLMMVALVIGLVFVILITILLDFLREINDKIEVDTNGNRKYYHASKLAIIIFCILIAISVIGNTISKIRLPETIYIGTNDKDQVQEVNMNDSTKE